MRSGECAKLIKELDQRAFLRAAEVLESARGIRFKYDSLKRLRHDIEDLCFHEDPLLRSWVEAWSVTVPLSCGAGRKDAEGVEVFAYLSLPADYAWWVSDLLSDDSARVQEARTAISMRGAKTKTSTPDPIDSETNDDDD